MSDKTDGSKSCTETIPENTDGREHGQPAGQSSRRPITRRKLFTMVAGAAATTGIPTVTRRSRASPNQPVNNFNDVSRSMVDYDAIEPFSTEVSTLTKRTRPYFLYEEGCMSYPAVDKHGNTNAGLKPVGSPGGDCREKGYQQTYTRFAHINPGSQQPRSIQIDQAGSARYVNMYAQFFPKDQGNRYVPIDTSAEHRFDWEEIVVFLNDNGHAIKAAASSHGDYVTASRDENNYWDGDRVKITYGINAGVDDIVGAFKNNAFGFSSDNGRSPPMVDWDLMDASYRDTVQRAITDTDWGEASPKIIDGVFEERVKKAWRA